LPSPKKSAGAVSGVT